jgi:ferritin-like metal-binding protein YciE
VLAPYPISINTVPTSIIYYFKKIMRAGTSYRIYFRISYYANIIGACHLLTFFDSIKLFIIKNYFMSTSKKSTDKRPTSSKENRKLRAQSSRNSNAKAETSTEKNKAAERNSSNETGENSQLEKLFIDSLKDIYWAEKHLTKTLPKMKKAATTDELKSAFEEHLSQTEEHVTRLEEVFELCGKKAQAKKCDAMEGLIKEGESVIEDTEEGTMTRDAGLIMAAQKVEHYEIATYGSLVQFAKTLQMDEAAGILEQTLEEEKETDQTLTQIAEGNVNEAASTEGEEDTEEETKEETEEDTEEDTEEETEEEETEEEDEPTGRKGKK